MTDTSFSWKTAIGCYGNMKTCELHGGDWVDGGVHCRTAAALQDVAEERARQFARYGTNATLEDGSGPQTRWLVPYTTNAAHTIEAQLRVQYEEYEDETGAPTWVHLLREEMAEVFMEDDPTRLRAELLQVAALAVSWVEKLDARAVTA